MTEQPGQDSRRAALTLLDRVLARRQNLDDAFDGAVPDSLEQRDRSFVRLLVATTLRRLGQIDAAIDLCLEKPLTPKARAVRDVLRLGATQLLFLGTPPHAAVDGAVDLCVRDLKPYRPLVNAVLRRLARDGDAIRAPQDAARLNTPDWLWDSWTSAYGDAARAIAAAHLAEAPLDITVKGDAAAFAAPLDATLLPSGSLRRPAGGAVDILPGFAEGAWWVQDAAAALPARLLGDIVGKTVIDLCAAPGGKTAQLVAAGGVVTAVDRSASRLGRVQQNLGRLGLAAEIVAADALVWRPAQRADAVLLDAPCSATGTIRRHPDIPYLKSQADVLKLAALQSRLLEAAAAMLKPGGVLVYCTCSLQPEEGEAQAALAAQFGLAPEPIAAAELGLDDDMVRDGVLRTLPFHWAARGGMDGFFAARFRRA